MGQTMVATGQIRVRKDGASQIATAHRVRVGEEHATLANVFQLYDADTGKACGGWSARGIVSDYPSVEVQGERVWASPSGETLLTRDGSALRAWAVVSSANTWELYGQERTNALEAWALHTDHECAGLRDVADLWQKQAREAAAESANLAASVDSLTKALASMEKTLRATEAELADFRAVHRGQP